MGTKSEPGNFDCYANAEDDEPMFVLLGRDPDAPEAVRGWIRLRAERKHLIEPDGRAETEAWA